MYEIVVGVDESVASQRALDRALLEGRASGRPLRVVHTWSPPSWSPDFGLGFVLPPTPADLEERADQVLEDVVAKALADQASPPTTLVSQVLPGDARQVLVETTRDSGLLVVGGRGTGELKSALLGSVTLHVLHHATCPLMIVPDPGAPAGTYQRVVVGADGSPASRSAMAWALDAAVRHQCPLVVMHAWLLTTLPGRPPMPYVPELREYETEAGTWLEHEVSAALPDRRGVDVRLELSHSAPSWALLDKAGPDDLLVVGSRGRGGFSSLLLGSVASRCAQRSRGSVVVVRAGEERLDP